MLDSGSVIIFTGDGKGKTTAAIGSAVRAVGLGFQVFIVFFMKKDRFERGEVKALSQLANVTLASFGRDAWVDRNNILREDRKQAGLALTAAREAITSGKYDLVILDEVTVAANYELVEVDELVELIEGRSQKVALILTGRYADARLIQIADTVTEMLMIKHPFATGTKGNQGIDF
jgi:cob(I)alamin adenosyltransferase